MMKMEIKKNCTCDTNDVPELKHHKCLFCGWVDDTDKPWHTLDDGFLCESCYWTAKLGLKVDFVMQEKRMKAHNKNIKKELDEDYLKCYGKYLFDTPVKSAYDE